MSGESGNYRSSDELSILLLMGKLAETDLVGTLEGHFTRLFPFYS